ncbi:unnamed protein product [Rhizophagus irregularis]|nr:unnamed protein product [Rhizophagus irregularis]
MDDNRFLPKLSQNLLKILDDNEYYDITIEVGFYQQIKRKMMELCRVVKKNYAIFNDHTYGPSFGGVDLVLRGNSGYCIKDSYKKQIRGPSSESVLHYGVFCDYCKYTIRGLRWKCTYCRDYDLCQDCKPKSHIHRHPNDHVFKLIPHSESAESAPQFAVHYGIVCKSCNKKIQGMRWNCTFCNNYNLCQDCKFKSPNIDKHPNNHAFRPIAYSDSISVFLNRFGLIENAVCDYCESECISGRCHKCANENYKD